MPEYSADNPYKDKDLSNKYLKQNADKWEYNKKTYGAGGVSILNDADGSKRRANEKLASDMKADQAKPLFGGGIPTAANRTGAAMGMGMGTSKASVGRQNAKVTKPSISPTAKAADKSAPAKTASVPASKPAAKKKAVPAKAKAKPREDSWKNMTRTGMKDSNGPKKLTVDKNKPKRVSPGAAAIKAAQPNRKDYRGAMVLQGPMKSKSNSRKG